MALQRNHRGTIAAWCVFDWANSAFTTLVVTFVYSTYFTKAIAPDEITGTAWWARSVSLAAIVVALASPVLGALADRGGMRRRFLAATTIACVTATVALAFVAPGQANAALEALLLFTVANIGFELGNVFYNAFLPDIVTPERIGRVSGWGWGLGYAGGLVCLVLALVGFVRPESPWFGLSTEEGFNVRATNLLVAVWFGVFSLPLLLSARGEQRVATQGAVRAAMEEVWRAFHQVRRFREAAKLLLARLFYNDGLSTIFAFGGIYAAGTFGMSFTEILVFGIALNVAAGVGAFVFGFVDDRIGGKKTVMASVVALIIATTLAVWAPSRAWLWTAGLLIGVFAGPNQAASRSLMGRFVPDGRESEFFGFFAFSGKLASFLGPFLLGVVTESAGSQRAGVATIIAFFLVGGAILATVDEARGIRASREADPAPPG
jgi:UMF1 family MFS transporter